MKKSSTENQILARQENFLLKRFRGSHSNLAKVRLELIELGFNSRLTDSLIKIIYSLGDNIFSFNLERKRRVANRQILRKELSIKKKLFEDG